MCVEGNKVSFVKKHPHQNREWQYYLFCRLKLGNRVNRQRGKVCFCVLRSMSERDRRKCVSVCLEVSVCVREMEGENVS